LKTEEARQLAIKQYIEKVDPWKTDYEIVCTLADNESMQFYSNGFFMEKNQ